ncbi:MAG TPA: tetratricopeptide repeat protein [Thermoanaerobaculia bacterium]|nr:tetratricopeptide repeat protein [Thermoanaerobaculia bacterium]
MRLIPIVLVTLAACWSTGDPGRVAPAGEPAQRNPASEAARPAPEPEVEAVSLLGEPLARPQFLPEVTARREQQLEEARAELERNPGSADALIWVGRRLAYLGRYRETIEVFSEGVRRFPNDARFLRHRGHRFITVREVGRAVEDLEQASRLVSGKRDEIEPDGLPNARNIPVSTLHSNICYHLGLAYYLQGDFERALPVYQRCAVEATNPDQLVSVSHWLYMTLRRLGRPKEAEHVLDAISSGLDVIENMAYHKLLLMYRREIAPEELMGEPMDGNERPTILYGIGNWYLYNGEPGRGRELFTRILTDENWPAFGHIAAEAELAGGR